MSRGALTPPERLHQGPLHPPLLRRTQLKSEPGVLSTRGTPRTMDVRVRRTGQVEVDDMIDVGYVETSGSDVRGDEYGVLAGLEPDDRSVSIVSCEGHRCSQTK
jgi:hypothetical protein